MKLSDDKLMIFTLAKDHILKESISELSDQQLKLFVNKICLQKMEQEKLRFDYETIYEISIQIFYRIRGYGVLENLLSDDEISEIMVNDIENIFIEKHGHIIKSNYEIEDLKEYYRIIQKIVSKSGREVNLSNPIVDARLEDGSRVNIVLPPIAKEQPIMTIRKFPKHNIDINFLIRNKTISQEVADFIEILVRTKHNILVGGGTSSGKTTFLNAMTEFIGDDERIVTIEDSRELQIINKKNLLSLETRNSNTSNRGLIEISELIKNSLRMRPDRIIVGEVRSKETIDMLTALNTGHDGGITTAHANSTIDMLSRLETMVLRSDLNIPLEAVKRMIGSSLEILIHLAKVENGMRKVVEISEIYLEEDKVCINKLYDYNYETKQLEKTGNQMIRDQKIKGWYYGS